MGALNDGNSVNGEERLTPAVWPIVDPEIADVLQRLAADGSWGNYEGLHAEQLVESLAKYHDIEWIYLCSSGTFAVELALRAVGVQAGDHVILAAYDFPGNFRAIEAIGAKPVLVDIEPDTCCLDPQQLVSACESVPARAMVVSHLHGGLADMAAICQFAEQHGVSVVEDACQAPGAVVQGRRAGTWGDVGVLSFGGSKLLTAGRGGAILTRRADVLQRAKIYCERGNHAFPLSEIQAALLLPQLGRLDERNRVRRSKVAELFELLKDVEGLRPITSRDRGQASYYKVAWHVEPQGGPREILLEAAKQVGAEMGAGFRGFARRGVGRCHRINEVQHSRSAAERLVLLHHPILLAATVPDFQRLAGALRSAITHNPRASM